MTEPREQAGPAWGERELKWILPAQRGAMVGTWLANRLRPDRDHPDGHVVTLYYDTPGGTLYDAKRNSDYLKEKVRLRWYEDSAGRPQGPTAFLEVKAKIGSQRRKLRRPAPLDAATLSGIPLTDRRLLAVLAALGPERAVLPAPLLPVLVVRYARDRFVDPASSARVAFDRAIRVAAVHPAIAPAARRPRLDVAVVEVKGERTELPASLRFLRALGTRRGSFSKYAACREVLASGLPIATVWRRAC